VKEFRWSKLKDLALRIKYGVSFEEIIGCELIEIIKHPKRAHQRIYLFWWDKYIWAVPCVIDRDHIFLKTLYPSRKYTKMYGRSLNEEN
jgi:hypothetical protein